MSDKTRKDDFDTFDQWDMDIPGGSSSAEQKRVFTFREDYSEEGFDLPRERGAPSKKGTKPDSAQEKAVFAAMKKLSGAMAGKAEEKPPEEKASVPVKAPPTSTQKPETAIQRSASKGLARRRRGSQPPERVPVTIGQTLRSDEMLVYDSELDEIDYTDEEDMPELRDYMPVRFRRHGRVGVGGGILYGLFVISVSIVLACFAWMCASDVLALNKEEKSAVVTIDVYEPTGDMPETALVGDEELTITADIDQVANALKNAGIIEYKWLFKVYAQLSNAETKIDPGTYDVSTELDYRALVTTLQFGSGKQEVTRVTFPEGLTIEQVFTLLEENQICSKSDLYEAAANYDFDYDFLEDLPLGDASRLEGYLFPDTYDFYQGESATVAISRFLSNTQNKLDGLESQAQAKNMSLHEVIIVASLVEKEAGSDAERATIASVIYNRLNAGWTLGLDSTINYILGSSTFDLTADDLAIDSPYNTYLYSGLPAGPICSPGMASIEAALDPESTNYWYWYAYNGETTFFTNDADFNEFAASHPY